jgi:4-hydroxybenzoate polyprenyltransferase
MYKSSMIKSIFISMRPKQWYKNLVIFAGILFSLNLFKLNMWLEVIAAFLIFCMISGSVYLINDIIDCDRDKVHPKKKKRPIASGELSIFSAFSTSLILLFVGLGGAYFLNILFFYSTLSYFILMLAYTLSLKNYFLVDILTISVGFVVRAIAGCLVINVIISPWLILCAFFLALLLATGKRRHELILMGEESIIHRENLNNYSLGMLEQMISITTAVLIISYSLYTFLTNNIVLMVTIPFIVYGIFRYLYLIHRKSQGGEPEMLFNDRGLIFCLLMWILLIIIVLYTAKLHIFW